jgi:hypothetical protein
VKYEAAILSLFSKALHAGASECIGVEATSAHMEHHDAADILFGSPQGRAFAVLINEACRISQNPSASRLDKLTGVVTRIATSEAAVLDYERTVGKAWIDRDLLRDD